MFKENEFMIWLCEHFKSFIDNFEYQLRCDVQDFATDAWDEDRLTGSLLKSIASKSKSVLNIDGSKVGYFDFEAYRLKGKDESKNGDIAFLVRVHTDVNKYFHGVAFYEAKKVYFKGGEPINIGAAKSEQLHRLDKNSNASNVLIYNIKYLNNKLKADVKSMPTNLFNQLVESIHGPEFKRGPSVKLLDYGKNFVFPFLDTFTGFHLDFNTEVIDPILNSITDRKKDYASPSKLPLPNYLITVDCYKPELKGCIKEENKLTNLELIPCLVNIMPTAYKDNNQTES